MRKDGTFATGVLHLHHKEWIALRCRATTRAQHRDRRRCDPRASRPLGIPGIGAAGKSMIFAMTHPRFAARQALVADSLALALVLSVPLSTSATAILAVAWLISVIATLRLGDIGVVRAHAALWLPFGFVALGIVGMLWADVAWIDRWKGLDSFIKLAAIRCSFSSSVDRTVRF